MKSDDDDNCSCTNCVSTIGPDKQSIQQLREKGSKIDKLYYGEYLPLRERKLLNKLVKTRAIYDDLRNEILPGEECTDTCMVGDPQYFNKKYKEDRGDNEAKNAVRRIVDTIDRGEIPPTAKPHRMPNKDLDHCQTRCYEPKKHHYKNVPMHKKAQTTRKVNTHSSSQLHAKHKAGNRHVMIRNVHFDTKYIHSDPCTCTRQFLGHAHQEKPARNQMDAKTPTKIQSKAIKAKRCICECNIRNKSFSQKSLQMMRATKDRMRQSVIRGISKLENKFRIKKDSIMLYRDKLKRKKAMKKYECERDYCITEECLSSSWADKVGNIKRSVSNIAKRISETSMKPMKRKIKSNHVCICEPEPEPHTHQHPYYDRVSSLRQSVHDMVKNSIHDITKVASDASVKIVSKIKSKRKKSNHICLCEPEPEPEQHTHQYYDRFKSRIDSMRQSIHELVNNSIHNITKIASDVSMKAMERIKSKRKKSNHVCICEPESELEPYITHKIHGKHRQPTFDKIHYKPDLSIRRVTKHSIRSTGLNIHVKPLTLKKKKTKKVQRVICKCDTTTEKRLERVSKKTVTEPIYDSNAYSEVSHEMLPFPRVCEASICIPGECDYKKCAEILMSKLKSRDGSIHSSDKAIGDLSTKHKKSKHSQHVFEHTTKSEDMQRHVSPIKPVVRIGSNFSFNIEFYKESAKKDTEDIAQKHIKLQENKEIQNKPRPKRVHCRNKSMQSERKLCKFNTLHCLKRCSCTLALKDKPKAKISSVTKEKSSSINLRDKKNKSNTCECRMQRVQETQTKSNKISIRSQSFARDSFFDSVEKCDPVICEKRLKERLVHVRRRHSIGSTSPANVNKCSIKSQYSNVSSDKYNGSGRISYPKEPTKLAMNKPNTILKTQNTSSKNVVRISSSFSFGVEFYKNREPQNYDIPLKIEKDVSLPFDDGNKVVRNKSSRHISTESFFNETDPAFNEHCSASCNDSMPRFSSSKSQTSQMNNNKIIKLKPKKAPKHICDCDITRTTQTKGPVVHKMVPLSLLEPFCTQNVCDPFCLLSKNEHDIKHKQKCKRLSTNRHLKSVSSNTVKSLSDASTSKRQILKQRPSTKSKEHDTIYDKQNESQAVRIGSNFSFNIEFYKDRKAYNDDIPLKKEKLFEPKPAKRYSHISTKSSFNAADHAFKKHCSESCDRIKPKFTSSKSQTSQLYRNKVTKMKPAKEIPKDICDCEITRTTQTAEPVVYKSPTLSMLRPHCTQDICDPFCLLGNDYRRNRYKQKCKRKSTKIRLKSVSNNTAKSFSDASSSKRQMLKQRLKSMSKNYNATDSMKDELESRQATRIGSNFSFNIEFYKERQAYNDEVSLKKENKLFKSKPVQRHSHVSTKSSLNTTEHAFKKHCSKSCDRLKPKFNSSKSQTSQTYKNKVIKMKPAKEIPKDKCDCDITHTTQTAEPVSHEAPALSMLHPHCTQDVCDPFCLLSNDYRWNEHKQKCNRKSTNRYLKSVSNNTVKSFSDASSSKRQMLKQRQKSKSKDYNTLDSMQDESRHRQAIRIGSNFSFNIEFYKDGKNIAPNNKRSFKDKDKKISKAGRYSNSNRIKNFVDIPRRSHQKSIQVTQTLDAPKESIVKPFFEKCLCALNILRSRKNTMPNQQKIISKNQKSQTCQMEMRKPTYHSLYQSKPTTTDKVGVRSLSSGTSKSYIKSQKLQNQNPDLNNYEEYTKETDSYRNKRDDIVSSSNERVVRIGSSFSFNIEFYKERGDYAQNFDYQRSISTKEKQFKPKNMSLHNEQKRTCNKKHSMQNQTKEDHISEHTTSIMKKCLCSLRLLKRSHESPKPQTRNKSVIAKESKKAYLIRILAICECEKSIDTKSFKQLRNESYSDVEPKLMKCVSCNTANKPIKFKTQKNQSNLCEPSNYTKNIKDDYDTPLIKPSHKKSVIISSSFSIDINFSKDKGKSFKAQDHARNFSKTGSTQNIARLRRSSFVSKKGRTSNFGAILKNCLCQQNKDKDAKRIPIMEEDIISTNQTCDPNFCQKLVAVNKKQRKVKSVLDVKNPSLMTKKVKSNLREASTKIHSDQSIKREIPKQKHRHKASFNRICPGPTFKYNAEFLKQFGSLEDDGSINYKKLREDQRGRNYNKYTKLKKPEKKIGDKRLCASHLPVHREYKVGYMMNKIPMTAKSPFEQQLNVCYVKVSNNKVWNSSAVTNPVIIPERNPFTNNKAMSRQKSKKKVEKKRVTFQENMDKKVQTKVELKYKYNPGIKINLGRFKHGKFSKNMSRKISKNNHDKPEERNEHNCPLVGYKCCRPSLHRKSKNMKKGEKMRRLVENKSGSQGQYKYTNFSIKNQDEDISVEVIKPYSKRKFRKSISKNCLKDKCGLKFRNEVFRDSESLKHFLKPNNTFPKKTLTKIRKSLHRSTDICNEICMVQAKTNLVKSITTPNTQKPLEVSKKNLAKNIFTKDKPKQSKQNILTTTALNQESFVCLCTPPETNEKYNILKGINKLRVNKSYKRSVCSCGSSICKKVSKPEAYTKKKIKAVIKKPPPCTCGSEACKKQMKKEHENIDAGMQSKDNIICECSLELKRLKKAKLLKIAKDKEKKKIKKKKKHKKPKTYKKKERAQSECCAALKALRKEREEQKLQKYYDKTSDTMLVADSFLDVIKMSWFVMRNSLKGAFKLATEPKKSYEDFKNTIRSPSKVKSMCLNSDITKTAIRMKRKIGAMRVTKNTKTCLESNAVTKYIIHSLDQNPSRRLMKVKKKMRRRKERMDFECSPYMASLRRRPHLWFYDRFPRMYPQFLSMLGLWRQFLDIILFLVAVAVWSPCILGVEICRALMCCCLCTG